MESGLCVSLHFLSLANTFIVQSGPAHEEAGSECVSERARFQTVVTWLRVPCTSNGPPGRSCGPPPCFRNPKGESKASSVRRKKRAIGWIFKHVLGHTSLGLPKRKMQILPPRTSIQLDTQCPHRIQECPRQT